MNASVPFLLLSFLLGVALGQVTCSGALTAPNPVTSDVLVPPGASCELRVNVTGSVSVGLDAIFSTSGLVLINGGLSALNASNINLGGSTTIQGGIMVMGANAVNTGPNVAMKSVAVSDVTTFTHRGRLTDIEIRGDGVSRILGGKVASGLSRGSGIGGLTACGAEISGGIAFVEATGSISMVAGADCAPSILEGDILMEKCTGSVTVVGAVTTATDLIVVEVEGNVMVKSSNLSDISVSGLDGSLTLSAAVDSDTTISGITGPIFVAEFSSMGDLSLVSPGADVTITNSEFGDEAVSVTGAGGSVQFTNVANLNLNIEGTPSVTVAGSSLRGGKFTGNTVLTLNNNQFSTIVECVENGAVNGGGNTIPDLAFSSAGQCASILQSN